MYAFVTIIGKRVAAKEFLNPASLVVLLESLIAARSMYKLCLGIIGGITIFPKSSVLLITI